MLVYLERKILESGTEQSTDERTCEDASRNCIRLPNNLLNISVKRHQIVNKIENRGDIEYVRQIQQGSVKYEEIKNTAERYALLFSVPLVGFTPKPRDPALAHCREAGRMVRRT